MSDEDGPFPKEPRLIPEDGINSQNSPRSLSSPHLTVQLVHPLTGGSPPSQNACDFPAAAARAENSENEEEFRGWDMAESSEFDSQPAHDAEKKGLDFEDAITNPRRIPPNPRRIASRITEQFATTPADILPLNYQTTTTSRRGRKPGRAQILTATSHIEEVRDLQKRNNSASRIGSRGKVRGRPRGRPKGRAPISITNAGQAHTESNGTENIMCQFCFYKFNDPSESWIKCCKCHC